MSHLERYTGPLAGSASQIFCRRCGRQEPNWMALGLENLSEEALKEGVMLSGAAVELHMRWGFRFFW